MPEYIFLGVIILICLAKFLTKNNKKGKEGSAKPYSPDPGYLDPNSIHYINRDPENPSSILYKPPENPNFREPPEVK